MVQPEQIAQEIITALEQGKHIVFHIPVKIKSQVKNIINEYFKQRTEAKV
jgi:hypothetical protein